MPIVHVLISVNPDTICRGCLLLHPAALRSAAILEWTKFARASHHAVTALVLGVMVVRLFGVAVVYVL